MTIIYHLHLDLNISYVEIPEIMLDLYTLQFYFNVVESNFRFYLEEFRDKAADVTE